MAEVTFTETDGVRRLIQASAGYTLMEVAVWSGVSGIPAECGGNCACATCHVYVDAEWIQRLSPPGVGETELLEGLETRRVNSRLSCQIKISEELDGLEVTIPGDV
jgi:2Fe-2S ferredoxin